MKLTFLLLMLFIQTVSMGSFTEKRIKKQEYYYQEYHEEKGKYGEMLHMGTKIYNDDGKPLEERRMYQGDIDEVIKFTLDRSNRVVAMDIWNEMRGEKRKVVYTYEGEDVAVKNIYVDGKLVDREINIFDDEGRVVKTENKRGVMVGYVYDDEDRVVMKSDNMVKNIYSYDDEGNLKKDICEVDGVTIYRREYEYDDEGRLGRMVEYKPKGFPDRPACTREILYTYNERGDKVEERWRENYSDTWSVKKIVNTYNSNGDLTRVREYLVKGDGRRIPVGEHRYKYEYHQN